ncbi:MAG: plasmid stabilization system protein ParE [Bradymonadia bacterium]
MTSVRWTRGAIEDLKEIRSYIALDDAKAAARWIQRLRERAGLASHNPGAGRVVPEFGRDDIREVFVRSYRLVYRALPAEIHVLTVFEGRRLLHPSDISDE